MMFFRFFFKKTHISLSGAGAGRMRTHFRPDRIKMDSNN